MAKKKGGLRDKYKPVKIEGLKKKIEQEDSIMGAFSRDEFLEIEEGKSNKFRLLPPHEGVDYYVMRKRYWLTVEGKDGDPSRRTVLDSRVHGGTKKDIVDEYVKWVTANVKKKSAIEAINAWQGGLKPEHSFIAYAVKIGKDSNEFGLLSFKKTVRDAINKATFVEDDDEPIEIDPFTDVDEGLPLIIKYNSKPNKKKGEDYYDVQVGKKAIPIDDEDLEKFDQSKSLIEMFTDVYTLKEYETALEGLKYFDAEHEIDAFEEGDWLDIVEEVKSQYSDDEDEDDEDEKPKKSSKKPSKKKVEEEEDEDEDSEDDDDEDDEEDSDEEGDEFDDMDEDELKSYIKKNKLSIKPKKSWDEDDYREAIREALSEEDEDDDSDDEEEEEEEKPKKSTKTTGKLELSEIRNRLKNKK